MFLDEFFPTLERLDNCDHAIFSGDFNIDLLKIDSNSAFNKYLELFMTKGFLPTITKSTRFSSANATLIDHVFIKSHSHHDNFSGIFTSVISDNLATICGIPSLSSHSKRPTYVNYCKNTPDAHRKIYEDLLNINWPDLLSTRVSDNPEDNYNIFINTFVDIKKKTFANY